MAWHTSFSFTSVSPRLRFAVLAIAGMASYYVIGLLPWVDQSFFPYYLRQNAEAAAWLLQKLGVMASAEGTALRGATFAVNIKRGCDGIEPAWLLAMGILAYPARWTLKWPALVLGIALMQGINLVRVTSLFLIGIHYPSVFSDAHLEWWPAAFIVIALIYWLIWVRRSDRMASTAST